MYSFSPFLRDKIKNWPYNKLACSVLYYYLNIKIAKNNLNSFRKLLINIYLIPFFELNKYLLKVF